MATLYEQSLQAQEERTKRKANIEKLEGLIAADEDILAVIPTTHSNLEAIRERHLLHSHLEDLRTMLNEEIAAYNRAGEAPIDTLK